MSLFWPVQQFADWAAFTVLGLQRGTHLGDAVSFFAYDMVKIGLLLAAIIFTVTFMRSWLPPEKVKTILSRRFPLFGNVIASLIGVITPFCSCSAIPLFIGFVKSGVPLGVTFSYLVSAPMVNEVALVMLFGLFGWKVALLYMASGVGIAIISGALLGKLRLEHLVEDYVWQMRAGGDAIPVRLSMKDRASESWEYTRELFRKVYPYVAIGVALGAFIHGFLPQDFLSKVAGRNNPFAVIIAVAIGVPLYSNAAGTIPVVRSLVAKGLPMGTALAFMMSVTALSLPEMIILRKVLKPTLLALYFGIVTLAIMFTGYLFNAVL